VAVAAASGADAPAAAPAHAARSPGNLVEGSGPVVERLYTTNQLARLFGVVPTTVIDWVERDKLAAFKTLGGHRRITHRAVLEFLDRNRLPYPPAFAADAPAVVLLAGDAALRASCGAALQDEYPRARLFVEWHPIDALMRIGAERPRVVVFATPLAGLDSGELCARLRDDADLGNLRLVAIGSPEEELLLLAAGAHAFLTRQHAVHGIAAACRPALGDWQPAE
jgi:excisionase family DNA binding protein